MTVAELMFELTRMPMDAIVTDGSSRIEDVIFVDEYYDGDYANSKCPVVCAVVLT